MYLFATYALFLNFSKVRRWLILELHEMIRVSHVVTWPVVFILICDLVRHGGLLKLTKNGQFLGIFGHCGPLPQGFRQVQAQIT